MAQGRIRESRLHAVNQSVVLFGEGDRARFVRTGILEEHVERLPFSQSAIEELAKTWQYAQ